MQPQRHHGFPPETHGSPWPRAPLQAAASSVRASAGHSMSGRNVTAWVVGTQPAVAGALQVQLRLELLRFRPFRVLLVEAEMPVFQ